MEHALETGLQPYLRTPEAELSFVARHNLDAYATVALLGYILYFAHSKLCDWLMAKVERAFKAWLKKRQKRLKDDQ